MFSAHLSSIILVCKSVPTYAASTNICAGQGDNFLAAANNPSTTCQGATDGGGALGTNATQTGGVCCSLL